MHMSNTQITQANLDNLRINDRAPRIEAEHARAVQGEPNGGHAQQKCPHCEGGLGTHTMPSLDGAPCMICASCHQVSLAVDWLEGEPNDDREAIAREAYRELYPGSVNTHDSERTAESDLRESDRAYATWDSGNEGFAPGIICRRIADRVLAAGFSRATVPDAATEAIDRVRALHLIEPGTGPDYCAECEQKYPCPTVAALDGAPEPDREAQLERVATRLREIVYLCGDDLGCQCEEAQDASADLARELGIIAAERPTLTAAEVWAIAKAEHDYANDSDNVGAFVDSLTDALRTAGVAFDEQPFIDSGYLLPVEGEGKP